MWARTRRMSGTRDKSGREIMGRLEGGYQTLIDALGRRDPQLGGEIETGTTVATSDRRRRRARRRVVAGGELAPLRPRPLHAAPPQAAASCARSWRPRAGRPLPLPRRRLPARCGRGESVSPYYHAEHHGPARPADDRGRDDARRRPRVRRRPPALRHEVRRPGERAGAADATRSRPSTWRRPAAIFPEPSTRRHPRHGSCSVPGSSSRCTCSAGASRTARDVPGARPRHGVDWRTSTPRSSTARRCIGVVDEPVVRGDPRPRAVRRPRRGCWRQ